MRDNISQQAWRCSSVSYLASCTIDRHFTRIGQHRLGNSGIGAFPCPLEVLFSSFFCRAKHGFFGVGRLGLRGEER